MSTKIYNAYKVNMNHESFNQWAISIFEQFSNIQNEFIVNTIINEFIEDLSLSTEKKDLNSLFKDFIEKFKEESFISLDFSFVFYFYENDIYFQLFSDNDEHINLINSHKDIISFSYWNSTDKPENVSVEDWEHRKYIWDAIFDVYSSPSDVGLLLHFNGELNQERINIIQSKLESNEFDFQSIVPKLAKNHFINNYMKNNKHPSNMTLFRNSLKAWGKLSSSEKKDYESLITPDTYTFNEQMLIKPETYYIVKQYEPKPLISFFNIFQDLKLVSSDIYQHIAICREQAMNDPNMGKAAVRRMGMTSVRKYNKLRTFLRVIFVENNYYLELIATQPIDDVFNFETIETIHSVDKIIGLELGFLKEFRYNYYTQISKGD